MLFFLAGKTSITDYGTIEKIGEKLAAKRYVKMLIVLQEFHFILRIYRQNVTHITHVTRFLVQFNFFDFNFFVLVVERS